MGQIRMLKSIKKRETKGTPRIEEYNMITEEHIITSHKKTVLGPRSVNDDNVVEMVKGKKRRKFRRKKLVVMLSACYQYISWKYVLNCCDNARL